MWLYRWWQRIYFYSVPDMNRRDGHVSWGKKIMLIFTKVHSGSYINLYLCRVTCFERPVSQSIAASPLFSLLTPVYALLPPHWLSACVVCACLCVCACDRVDAHIILECDAWATVLKHHWWSSSTTVTKTWCISLYLDFINGTRAHFVSVTDILIYFFFLKSRSLLNLM